MACARNGLAARREGSAPLVGALEGWMRAERAKLSRHAAVAKAIDYMLTRWPPFTRFLEDGRICLTNNTAERALRGLALGRKSGLRSYARIANCYRPCDDMESRLQTRLHLRNSPPNPAKSNTKKSPHPPLSAGLRVPYTRSINKYAANWLPGPRLRATGRAIVF